MLHLCLSREREVGIPVIGAKIEQLVTVRRAVDHCQEENDRFMPIRSILLLRIRTSAIGRRHAQFRTELGLFPQPVCDARPCGNFNFCVIMDEGAAASMT
jgi:hypothetical protein